MTDPHFTRPDGSPPYRTQVDRRKKPTNPFHLGAHRGRRKSIRRREDAYRKPWVDQYGIRPLLIALSVMLLCAADGLYTLIHISRGAQELNPFMDGLIQIGPYVFFLLKYALTSLCVVLLVTYYHHPVAKTALCSIGVLYGVLLVYHLFLWGWN